MTPLEINKRIAELKGIEVEEDDFNEKETSVFEEVDHDTFVPHNWAEWIGDAWGLFEEMGRARMGIDSRVGIEKGEKFYHVDVVSIAQTFRATTAPMAICMAWIKWKEGK